MEKHRCGGTAVALNTQCFSYKLIIIMFVNSEALALSPLVHILKHTAGSVCGGEDSFVRGDPWS